MNISKQMDCTSDYFTLYKLNDSCYAAIEKEGNRTGSNAGFVDLGDKVIVFDTFLSIDAAKDLKKCVEEISGKNADFVINSHEHTDHYVGNQLFDAPIISSKQTKDAFEKFQQTLDKVAELPEDWVEKRLLEIQNEKDETKKRNLDNELNFIYNLKDKGIKATLPNEIISETMKLQGERGTATLEIVENAHSSSDILMIIEEQKVCFMGDLLFSECYPWIGSGDPKVWNYFMQVLVEKDIEYFIPGHGPIATKKEVYQQIKYIKEILELSKKYFEEKRDIKEINPSDLSNEFEDWDDMVFKWNNNFLSAYYEKK